MNRTLLTAGLLALAAASQSSAGTLTYTDRGAWTSQVTSLINFDSCGVPPNPSCPNGSFGLGGVYFTNMQVNGYSVLTANQNTMIEIFRTTASAPYFEWGAGGTGAGTILYTNPKVTAPSTNPNTIYARISFTSPVSAFGFNFGAGGGSGAPGSVTIAPNGLAPINVTTTQGPAFTFWGVTSNTQTFTFADIYINDANRFLVLDDIAQGSFSAAPPPVETAEPGTLLQLAMGAVLLAIARRRFGSAQTQTS